jgi:cell division protein FtsZ
MAEMGKAMMGTGEMEGEGRALKAAEAAISNPLLDDVSMKGARAVLVNVTGGPDLMLFEVDEAVNRIRAEVDCDANILFGSALLENMEGRVRVSVVATGIDAESCTPYVAENVRPLHAPRRRTIESDAPVIAASAPRMNVETSAVGRMMDNLAMQLETHMAVAPVPVPEPVVKREPAAVIPVPPPKVQIQPDEPLVLGGADAPMIQEPVHHTVTLRVEPAPAAAPKRRRFGLFGLRRTDREEYPVEPRLEAPMPIVTRQSVASATPTRPATSASAQASVQPATQAQAPTARAQAEPPRQQAPTPSPEDLFAGVSEDDRFEIPAFLRRQANTGG